MSYYLFLGIGLYLGKQPLNSIIVWNISSTKIGIFGASGYYIIASSTLKPFFRHLGVKVIFHQII